MATLLTHFKMDSETSGVVSDEVASNDLTINGTATIVSGIDSNALSIDTANSNYGSFTWPSGTTTSHTVSAWYKFDNFSVQQKLWSKRTVGAGATDFQFTVTSATQAYWFIVGGGGVNAGFTFPALSTDTWYLFTAVYDGANVLLYINGDLISSTPYAGTIDNNSPTCRIGEDWAGTYGAFDVDDFRVYDSGMTAQEVSDSYDSYFGTSTYSEYATSLNPLAHWKLDETSGTTAVDSSGNGYDATHTGSPTLAQNSLISSQPDKASIAFAAGSFVSGTGAMDFTANEVSVSAFINLDSLSTRNFIITKSDFGNTAYSSFFLEVRSTGEVKFSVQNSTGDDYPVVSTPAGTIVAGTTYHIVATWKRGSIDASDFKIYVDGVSSGSTYTANGYNGSFTIRSDASNYHLGRREQDTNNFNGRIDDALIFNTELTAGQVLILSTKASDATSLTYSEYVTSLSPSSWYRFAGTSGTDIVDEVSALNGTTTSGLTREEPSLIVIDPNPSCKIVNSRGNTIPNSSIQAVGTGDFSISFWIQTDNTTNDHVDDFFLDMRNSGTTTGWHITTGGFGGTLSGALRFVTGTGTSIVSSSLVNDEQPHMCTITRSGTDISVYIDGVVEATGTDSSNYSSTTGSITLGFNSYADGGNGRFTGWLDELTFFTNALSSFEIQSIYTKATDVSGLTYSEYVNALSPVAYWRLGETSGTNIVDEVGNYDLTVIGSGVDLGETGLLLADSNTSVKFDGTNSYLLRSEPNFRSTDTSGSISFLIKKDGLPEAWAIFGRGDTDAANNRFSVALNNSSDPNYTALSIFTNDSGSFTRVKCGGDASLDFSDNTTRHVVITSDGSTWKIYVDGVEQSVVIQNGSNSGNWFGDISGADNITIGMERYSTAFQGASSGWVDELAIFSSTLTASEVSTLYSKATDVTNLTHSQYVAYLDPIAWYKFDEQSGASINGSLLGSTFDTDLDATYWTEHRKILTSDITSTKVVSGGKLEILIDRPNDPTSSEQTWSNYYSKYYFDSSFEMVIDVDAITYTGTTSGNFGAMYFYLHLEDIDSDSYGNSFYRLGLQRKSTGLVYTSSGGWGSSSAAMVNSNGRLKITRTAGSGTIKAFVEDGIGNGFVEVSSYTPAGFERLSVGMTSRLLPNSASATNIGAATLDNLSITGSAVSGAAIVDSVGYNSNINISDPTFGSSSLVPADPTGKSITYDNVDNEFSVIDYSAFFDIDYTGKLAVSFWIETGSDVTTKQGIVSRGDWGDYVWGIWLEAGKIHAKYTTATPTTIREESAGTLAANTKYLVVVNFTGFTSTDEIEIYVDGTKNNSLVSSAAGTYADNTWSYIYVGVDGPGDTNNHLSAKLDNLLFFSDNLTSTEVSTIYSKGTETGGGGGPTGVEAAITALTPSAYWKLDDGSGEAVTDSSGNGYDGYWVGVGSDEATQDDMLSDGVLGIKPSTLATTPTGYMENTAVFALGSADTGDYTLLAWAKGFDDTDFDVFSWATTAISSTKQYRGTVKVNSQGEVVWNRLYQSGPDVVNDTAYQSTSTSGLGLVNDVPYLIALRESQTLTEILVNGSVVISLPRIGMEVNDTTYAPREELRIGNETIYSGDSTASSYVHGALWNSNLSDANILSIYDAWSAIDKTGDMVTVQSGQTGTGTGTKTGTLSVTGTIVGYQEDRLLEGGEFISQSVNISATYTSPDNYIVSNQIPQGIQMVGVSTGDPLTVRYSTHGITTTPDSDPADTPIAPRLLNAGNYKNEIDISDVGVVTPSYGQVVLDNSDGGLDNLVDKAFDGGSYKLYYGPKGGKFPDDFTKVVDTVMGKPTFDHKSVKIQLKDKMDFLDVPVIDQSFTGTGNSNGTSIVKGEPKQRVIGRVWGAPVQLMDATKLVYWVASDEMASDNVTSNNNGYTANDYRSTPNNWNDTYATYAYGRVFDGGTQITNGQDYASEADLFAIEPSVGTVRWYRPSGFRGPIMFRLGSSPAADIRVDVETTTSAASNWTLNEIVGERPEFDISSSSTDVSLVRGFFVNDNSFTYKDAVKEFMKRDFYFARFDRAGEFKVSQVATPDPSATPLYEFNEANMSNVVIEQVVPAWKLYINSGEAVGGQVNTGVDDARKDEFTETPYHTISEYEEPSTRSRHKLSEIINVETKSWWNESDVSTHSDLAKVFLMEDRVKLTVSVDRGHMNSTTLALDIGDTVSVKIPRYNYDLGKNFIIHGVRHDYGTGRLTFTLWG